MPRIDSQVLYILNKEKSLEVLKGLLMDLCYMDQQNQDRLKYLYKKY